MYNAYIQYENVRTARAKLPTKEQKELENDLLRSRANYTDALAESLDGMTDLQLDSYVQTAMAGDVQLQLLLTGYTKTQQREWAKQQILKGSPPGLSGGSNSAEGYGNAVMVAP